MQLVLARLCIPVRFHNRPRHDAHVELLRQPLISAQVVVPLRAEGEEGRVLGHPVREMVFGQDGEVGAFGGGGSEEAAGGGEVVEGIEGLEEGEG